MDAHFLRKALMQLGYDVKNTTKQVWKLYGFAPQEGWSHYSVVINDYKLMWFRDPFRNVVEMSLAPKELSPRKEPMFYDEYIISKPNYDILEKLKKL